MEPDEILREMPVEAEPTDFYLTGILWPRNTVIGAAEDEKTDKAEGDEIEPSDDSGAPLFSVLKPSSIGLTCTIDGEDTPFEIVVRGAQYLPRARQATGVNPTSEESTTGSPGGAAERYGTVDWERKAFEYHLNVGGNESRQQWRTNRFSS